MNAVSRQIPSIEDNVQGQTGIGRPEGTNHEQIVRIAAYVIIAIGCLLVGVGVGMLIGRAFEVCWLDAATAQALFMCGLSAVLGGFTLQNAEYKGSIEFSHDSIPFKFKLV